MNLNHLTKKQLFIKLIDVNYQIKHSKGFHLLTLKLYRDKILILFNTPQ